jgi:DNA-binding SARP family transcriptional activator
MKLIAYNDLEEKSIILLMTALALQKNREALTKRYSLFTETLRQELGISPSHEVVTKYSQLMSELNA